MNTPANVIQFHPRRPVRHFQPLATHPQAPTAAPDPDAPPKLHPNSRAYREYRDRFVKALGEALGRDLSHAILTPTKPRTTKPQP